MYFEDNNNFAIKKEYLRERALCFAVRYQMTKKESINK